MFKKRLILKLIQMRIPELEEKTTLTLKNLKSDCKMLKILKKKKKENLININNVQKNAKGNLKQY